MIYVDDMALPADVPNGRKVVRGKWSHLYADTHEELMTMAQLIGLNPKWIQHPGTYKEHFDVVQSKRAAAVKAGAQPVSWRHAGEFIAARREAEAKAKCSMGDPCHQESCGACYPDKVLQEETAKREEDEELGALLAQAVTVIKDALPVADDKPAEPVKGYDRVWLGPFIGENARCGCGAEFTRPLKGEREYLDRPADSSFDKCATCEMKERLATLPAEEQQAAVTQWAGWNRSVGLTQPQREERQPS